MLKLSSIIHRSDNGATMVEYAIMAAAIAGILVAVAISIGQGTDNAFELVNSQNF